MKNNNIQMQNNFEITGNLVRVNEFKKGAGCFVTIVNKYNDRDTYVSLVVFGAEGLASIKELKRGELATFTGYISIKDNQPQLICKGYQLKYAKKTEEQAA